MIRLPVIIDNSRIIILEIKRVMSRSNEYVYVPYMIDLHLGIRSSSSCGSPWKILIDVNVYSA